MPTIDLTTLTSTGLTDEAADPPASTAGGPIGAAPRRIGLTLRELQHAAALAGGAPLPFDIAPPREVDAMQARLGQSPAALDDQAYRGVIDALHDPAESLARRGLVVDGALDAGLAGAIGLLAAPSLALDIDVTMAGVQAKVWHRQDGPAVASLATVDATAFEVAWFPTESWASELARIAQPSEELETSASLVPALVDLPFELTDAAAEASSSGRGDLLPVLVARHSQAVRGDDEVLTDDVVVRILAALDTESRGRLRALVADVSATAVETVGVVSWTLLADGWHALRPHRLDGELRLEVRAVTPEDLASVVAPALATSVNAGTAR